MMKKLLLVIVVLGALSGCRQSAVIPSDALLVFSAMGDVPYGAGEVAILEEQIRKLPRESAFLIHVGDIQSNTKGMPCAEGQYSRVASMLRRSKIPVFIIPGDNEYNDCPDPQLAWEHWQRHFMRFEDHWAHDFRVFRQLEREENFALEHQGVLFVGIHILSGTVHNQDEWKRRHADDLAWVRRCLAHFGGRVECAVIIGHAYVKRLHEEEFFKPFSEAAASFGKPVLYLQGDGHVWIHDRPLAAKNVQRVQVDQGGNAPPLKVTILKQGENPFVFDRGPESMRPKTVKKELAKTQPAKTKAGT